MALCFALNLPDPGTHRPWYHLDWSSLSGLHDQQRLLTVAQRYYLGQLVERMRRFSKSFDRPDSPEDDYPSVASMIAMACARYGADDRDASMDLPFKDRLLRCRLIRSKSRTGEVRHDGVCGQRRFCPYCNFLLREKALLTYVPAFDRGRWLSMTISTTTGADLEEDEPTDAWDAGAHVVRTLINEGHAQGAYWTEELHLESLWPSLSVLAHCHVILHLDGEPDTEAVHAVGMRAFRRYFQALQRDAACRGRPEAVVELEPSIRVNELTTPEDFCRACDYLTKTTRVLGPYEAAIQAVGQDERWRINQQFEQFLLGSVLMLETASRSPRPGARQQRMSLGTLRPGRSRRFVGIRPGERLLHRRNLRALRSRLYQERSVCHDEQLFAGA